jgi:sec-independent protein translocase protein TatA
MSEYISVLVGAIGTTELLLCLLIVLIIFGGSQIPRLMRGLGQGVSEFKKGLREGEKTEDSESSKEKK